MDFRILGPLEVLSDGQPLDLGAQKQRALLALLLLDANQVVPTERAIGDLWELPPRTAQKALQVYVSQLRKVLGPDRLQTKPPGYLLRIGPEELDLARFEQLQAEGRSHEALALWRGSPLPEFAHERFAQAEIARLEELRLGCLEERIDADLAAGRQVELVAELESLVTENPLRERLRGQLMLALYRSGRQAEALEVYDDGRRRLAEELGLDPGRALHELHGAILRRDEVLDAPSSSQVSPAPVGREESATAPVGTVTMLFTDIEGSTALVERLGEAYGDLRADHQRLLRAAFERHGGHEIDTQGDAFCVAFRRASDAVLAAVEAQHALAGHSWPDGVVVRVRMGIHTDEPSLAPEGWYHGLGVVRAARICAAGHGGQLLVSHATRSLIDEARLGVTARDLGEHRLKGLRRPEHVHQIVAPGLDDDFPPLRAIEGSAVPLEGREEELAVAAQEALERGSARPTLGRWRWLIAVGAVLLAVSLALTLVRALGGGGSHPVGLGPNMVGVIDAASGKITAATPVGDTPTAVAVGGGAAWVLNSGEGTLSRVDPKSHKVLKTISAGPSAGDLAVGRGSLWVASGGSRLSEIDPDSGVVLRTIELPQSPNPLARSRSASWVASDRAMVWATGDGTLLRVAPARLPPRSAGVCCDGVGIGYGSVWVTDASGISRFDARTAARIGRVRLPFNGSDLAAGAGAVWVVDPNGNSVWVIDPRTDQVVRTIGVGNNPQGVVVGSGSIWVATAAGAVVRIDPKALRVEETIPVGGTPAGIAFGEGQVWVTLD
jgi:YVTN family beta-propeller protein